MRQKEDNKPPKSPESNTDEKEVDGRSLKAKIIQNSMIKASRAAAKEVKEAAEESRKSAKVESKETTKKTQEEIQEQSIFLSIFGC